MFPPIFNILMIFFADPEWKNARLDTFLYTVYKNVSSKLIRAFSRRFGWLNPDK